MTRSRLPCLLLVTILAACGGRASQAPEDPRRSDAFRDFFTEDNLLLRRYDSSRDGVPDTFRYYALLDDRGETVADVAGMTLRDVRRTRLVRAELDLDHDGRINLIRHYDSNEQLRREEVDSAAAGAGRIVNHFEAGRLVRREIDHDRDGRVDEVRHYVGGQLNRIEFDDGRNGRIDRWHFFNDGVLVRIGYDRTGDGIIDERHVLQVVGQTQPPSRERGRSMTDEEREQSE